MSRRLVCLPHWRMFYPHLSVLRPTLLILSSQTVVRCVSRTSITDMSTSNLWRKIQVSQPGLKDGDEKINVDITVLDTHKHKAVTDVPTVIALTGMPAQSDEFVPFCSHLPERGVRLVVPYFPGAGPSTITKWQVRHLDFSPEGQAQLLCAILNKLDINRGGSWLGYKMAASSHMVKAVGFISAVGARPQRIMRPPTLVRFAAWLFRIEWLQNSLMSLLAFYYRIHGLVDVTSGLHLVATLQVVSRIRFDKIPDYAAKIAKRKLPIFMACNRNDRIIQFKIMEEMALKHMCIPEDCVIEYSEENIPNKPPLKVFAGDWLARFLVFERGGHRIHKTQTAELVEQILDLIKHTQKHDKLGKADDRV
ncbi:uncharacterized protein LOC121382309 isoform X2 [Gigantopelta aegis]|uniref:uncharacterized protein LOC121382309 isoform X2 n=1 Tax=Gigantopelta aegis TaxID=1735272 RepID=UPI001B88CE52|nr:uncharacterized protein LOC121382309 isoform X2 [Gigantopelta aegis]